MKVRPDLLVAHLEIFNELRPTLDALRLCNAFGQGPEAHITKLPIELIERIGMCLVEPERAEARQKWEQVFKCFRNKCVAIDHYDSRECSDAASYLCYSNYHEEIFSNPDGHCPCDIPKDQIYTLDEEETALVNSMLSEYEVRFEGLDMENKYLGPERDIHEDCKAEWLAAIADTTRGLLSSHDTSFIRTFGLEAVMCHGQRPKRPTSHRGPTSPEVTTDAYLLLSSVELPRQEWQKSWYDELQGDDTIRADSGLGPGVEVNHVFSIAPPTTPSVASLQRFPRALRMLGLECEETTDSGASTCDRPPNGVGGGNKDSCQPVFKLLTCCGDDGSLIG